MDLGRFQNELGKNQTNGYGSFSTTQDDYPHDLPYVLIVRSCNPSVSYLQLFRDARTAKTCTLEDRRLNGWLDPCARHENSFGDYFVDVHFQRSKAKNGEVPDRTCNYHVFKGTNRKRSCQRLQPPNGVEKTLQTSRDEDNVVKLEQMRHVINKEIGGREYVFLETEAHIESI